MTFTRYLMALAMLGLAACEPSGGASFASAPSADLVGGLAPPRGQTSAERQARKEYYRGPRGDEF